MSPSHLRGSTFRASDHGYAMVALLVAMSVMAILMSAAMPAWQTAARREKEAELIFRGEQYARAIGLFQRKYGNTSPPSIDILVTERFLRRKYKDPITGDDFAVITPTTVLPGRDAPAGLQGRGGTQPASGRTGRSSIESSVSSRGTTSSTTGRTGSARGASSSQASGRGATGRGTTQAGATGGIMGVRSKSTDKSLRVYKGSEHYNEWIFMGTQASSRAGGPNGAPAPGAPAGRGQPGPARGRGSAPTTSPGTRGSTPVTTSPFGRGSVR